MATDSNGKSFVPAAKYFERATDKSAIQPRDTMKPIPQYKDKNNLKPMKKI